MERFDGNEIKPGPIKWALILFAGALLFLAFLGYAANTEPEIEPTELTAGRAQQSAQPQAPEDTPEAELEAEQELEAGPESEPESEPPAPAEYVPTVITAGGREYGVLVSREAAEMLVSELIAYYEQKVIADLPGGFSGTVVSELDGGLELKEAEEGAETESYEELLDRLLEKGRPKVRTTVSTLDTETIAHKSETDKDRYLVRGTRVVEALGKDGMAEITTAAEYVNGKLRDESETERNVLIEPVTALVREGSAKAEDGEPGRNEGKKGPDTELVFIEPSDGKIVLNYGQEDGVLHLGLDYETDEGGKAVASADGRVISLMERGALGLVVEIDHGEGFVTRYALLQSALVEIGDTVRAGAEIGVIAPSEDEKALLHFELRIDGEAYNPRFYLD